MLEVEVCITRELKSMASTATLNQIKKRSKHSAVAEMLEKVTCWLVLNTLDSESKQFNMLVQQDLANVYRRLSMAELLRLHRHHGFVVKTAEMEKAEKATMSKITRVRQAIKSAAPPLDWDDLKVGMRVKRGPGWESGDADGGKGGTGVVTMMTSVDPKFAMVQWDDGNRDTHAASELASPDAAENSAAMEDDPDVEYLSSAKLDEIGYRKHLRSFRETLKLEVKAEMQDVVTLEQTLREAVKEHGDRLEGEHRALAERMVDNVVRMKLREEGSSLEQEQVRRPWRLRILLPASPPVCPRPRLDASLLLRSKNSKRRRRLWLRSFLRTRCQRLTAISRLLAPMKSPLHGGLSAWRASTVHAKPFTRRRGLLWAS